MTWTEHKTRLPLSVSPFLDCHSFAFESYPDQGLFACVAKSEEKFEVIWKLIRRIRVSSKDASKHGIFYSRMQRMKGQQSRF